MNSQTSNLTNTSQIINKGVGAGRHNTNYYGKMFEEKTNNEFNLLEQGFTKTIFATSSTTKYNHYLSKSFEDKNISFVVQNGLKRFIKCKYNIELFRCPDEAYIIEYHTGEKTLKIIEKKEQHVAGSVETKLWAAPSLKREYELVLGKDFKICYSLCINNYLQNMLGTNTKKYNTLNEIFIENNIDVMFGDDDNYFETVNLWIYKDL